MNILLVYPCVFDVAKKLTDNEYAPWKKCFWGTPISALCLYGSS